MNSNEIIGSAKEIEDAIIGLTCLKDTIGIWLIKINYEGLGKEDEVQLKLHFDLAIQALEKQIEPNEPLTLEELKQMYGDPVWVENRIDSVGYWAIVVSINTSNCIFVNNECNHYWNYFNYGETWLAYRRPLERS